MDIALVRVGVYAVHSQSGRTYHVDVFERECTCPDWQHTEPEGGCKHMRRVELDIDAGAVPRPDGRLPSPTPRIAIHDGGTTEDGPRHGSRHPPRTHDISGPHREFDRFDQPTDATYFRCDRCGCEAMHRRTLSRDRCPES